MNIQWKNQAETFISNGAADHLRNTVSQIFPNRNNIPADFRNNYEDIVQINNRSRLRDLLEHCTNQYSTFLFPSILTIHSAPNFWLAGERNEPNQQEAWKMIYMLLSSVGQGNVLMNLDNVGEEGRIAWRRQLVSEDPSQFFHGIRSELNISSRNWGTFFTALLAISYFAFRIRRAIPEIGLGLEEYFEMLYEQFDIHEDTTLIIFELGRKKRKYIILAR